jgi:hypothetical protein
MNEYYQKLYIEAKEDLSQEKLNSEPKRHLKHLSA